MAKRDSLECVADFVIVIYLPSLCFGVCRDENVIHVLDIALAFVLSLTCCMAAL